MSYNPNIPQPTDILAQSQDDILNNFQAIDAWVIIDHVDFTSPDQGKHNHVTFVVQPQPTPPAFNVGEVGLYNFLNSVTAVNELYITNSAGVSTPLSASLLSVTPNPGNNVSGWTYLPSGILLKWGNATATGNTLINFPTSANIPVFTNVMSMQVTTYANNVADTNTFVRLSAFTNTGFNVYGSSRTTAVAATTSFQYFAIGY